MAKQQEFEDDGRTIADMNVDGMPWYRPDRKDAASGNDASGGFTREEKRAYLAGALKAGLLIAAVFAGVYFLFILFCTNVWFA